MSAVAGAAFDEIAAAIPLDGDHLVAIGTRPAVAAETGLVIVVGGPQCRAGAQRQNVRLARHLAGLGIASLRFDCRGMGDASGAHPGFTSLGPDIRAAISWLREINPGLNRVFLWGLCDGASAILLNLPMLQDEIAGMVLLNPWARSEQGLAQAQLGQYLPRRALSPEFLCKLLTGRINPIRKLREVYEMLRRSRASVGQEALPARLHDEFLRTPVPSLILLAQDDMTAMEFRSAVLDRMAGGGGGSREIHILPNTDHTFSDPVRWAQVQGLVLDWVARR